MILKRDKLKLNRYGKSKYIIRRFIFSLIICRINNVCFRNGFVLLIIIIEFEA